MGENFWTYFWVIGAIAAMLTGLVSTFAYIYYFKFVNLNKLDWWFGVSPEGIGFVFMWLAMFVGVLIALMTKAPPSHIQDLVEDIRMPGKRREHGPERV